MSTSELSSQELVEQPDMDTPMNTDLAKAPGMAVPTNVSPLVAMLGSGQLRAEDVQQALELQKQHDQYQGVKLFNIAIANFRASVENVAKDGKSHNGTFATLGAISRAVAKPCGDNGLSYYWTQEQSGKEITVTCHLTHAAGHSIKTSMTSEPENSGGKTAMHAIASAVSYLKRYTLSSLLGIATEDDDGAGASAKPPAPVKYITDKQQSTLVDLLSAAEEIDKGFTGRFYDYHKSKFKANQTPLGLAIPANSFTSVKGSIEKSMAAAKKKAEAS